MPSSPPRRSSNSTAESPLPPDSPVFSEHPELDEQHEQGPPSDDEQPMLEETRNSPQNLTRSSTPDSPNDADLDARLAEYTLDFSQFPSGQFQDGRDDDLLPDWKHDAADRLSDGGGPEDFTATMEKYLMDEGMSSVRKLGTQEASAEPDLMSRNAGLSRQPAVEEEAESGDYSEFGPPVDMSTPSHLLHRTSALARDPTQLEDIEEDPVDRDERAPKAHAPVARKMSTTTHKPPIGENEREQQLREHIRNLEEELQVRNEQLERDHKRVLEAASAGEQIRHLQAELNRKNAHIDELQTQRDDEASLREQIAALKRQSEEHERSLRQSSTNSPNLSALQQQIHDMQQQLQNHDSQRSLDNERMETISHLRQQLQLAQQQLKKRDETLEETLSKLKELTQMKEIQLHDKNAEIDRLKAESDDQALEIERLETELDRVNADYESLEHRLATLETKNQPLEERNQSLEADLTRAQSQMEAQENALKAAAADLPINGRSTYSEILDLIKDLGRSNSSPDGVSLLKESFSENQDMHFLGQEITKLQQQLQEASAAQVTANAEVDQLRQQATESQTLIKTIEAENSRLTSRVEELTSSLHNTQHDLTRTQEELAESLEIVSRLQEEKLEQPPSPPPSPPKAHSATNTEINPGSASSDTAALEASHQAQIKSLQTAHSTAISTLRTSHAESMRKIRSLLTAAEQREADLRTKLTTLRLSTSSQETQLRKSFKAEVKRLQSVIAAKDETAAEIDQRIALSVDKREREWQRRVDLLLKERDRMAKVLMTYWGEKELGRGPGAHAETKDSRRREVDHVDTKQGQAYKYKYAQKRKSRSGETATS